MRGNNKVENKEDALINALAKKLGVDSKELKEAIEQHLIKKSELNKDISLNPKDSLQNKKTESSKETRDKLITKFAKCKHQYSYEINKDEAIRQFSEKLIECGLILESSPIMDGKIHRCKVDGDKGRETSGSYQGYIDGYPNGWIHNFKTNESKF